MTGELWQLLILLVVAVWLAAHDHRLSDNEPTAWDASPRAGEPGAPSRQAQSK